MIEVRKEPNKFLLINLEALDELTNKAMSESKLGKLELLILLRIVSFSWSSNGIQNHCKKPLVVLMKEFQRSRQTIERSLKELRRLGFIEHIYRVEKRGKITLTPNWKRARMLVAQGAKMKSAFYQVTAPGLGTKANSTQIKVKKPNMKSRKLVRSTVDKSTRSGSLLKH